MRSGLYRRRDGTERTWLKPADIEAMMTDELVKAKLYPTVDSPAVDVERLIDRHLRVHLDQYGELDPGVLGLTEFFPDRDPRIVINADLTGAMDQDNSELGILGRWRATLAHEASHVVMHRFLFDVDKGQQGLFAVESSADASGRLLRCEKKNVLFRGGGSDWREVQANMGMAALLMPEWVFGQVAVAEMQSLGIEPEALTTGSPAARELAGRLSVWFQVSRQAAGIRLETAGILSARGQVAISGLR